jgi:hypothetical protein
MVDAHNPQSTDLLREKQIKSKKKIAPTASELKKAE